MKIPVSIATTFLLLACSSGSEGIASAGISDAERNLTENSARRSNWISVNQEMMDIGDRRDFSHVMMDFLINQDDPSTAPTIYDSWTGIGYSWLYPEDKPSSPFQREIISSAEKHSWSKISLVRMNVIDAIPARADRSTVEYPWRAIVIAQAKWVDFLVFEPSEDCYKGAGMRCEFPDGNSFPFIESLKQNGGKLSPMDCEVDSFERPIVYKLLMPGKKPQTVWVYQRGGASGGYYTEFGIYYGYAESDEAICSSISGIYL